MVDKKINTLEMMQDVSDIENYNDIVDAIAVLENKESDEKEIQKIKDKIDDWIELTLIAAEKLWDNLYVREEDKLLYVYEKIKVKEWKYVETVSVYLIPYKFEVNVSEYNQE